MNCAVDARARHRHLDQLLHLAGMRRQHQDAVGEEDRLVEIVGDEDDGDVDLAPDFQQMRLHLGTRLRVERAERLVHQQNARLIGERAHDRHALLHAAGQLMRIGVGEFLQTDEIAAIAAPRCSASYLLVAVDLEAEHHVLLHGQPGEQRVALEHHAAVAARARSPACLRAAPRPRLCCSSPARMRTSVDLPQPDGPTTQRNSRRWVCEIDVVERQRRRALASTKHLAEVSHLEDDVALPSAARSARARGRLVEIGRQHRWGRRILFTAGPHALLSSVTVPREQPPAERAPARMSVPSPMMPIIMIAA